MQSGSEAQLENTRQGCTGGRYCRCPIDVGLLRAFGIPWRRGTSKCERLGSTVPALVAGGFDCFAVRGIGATSFQKIHVRPTQQGESGSLLDGGRGRDHGDAVSAGNRQSTGWLVRGSANAEEKTLAVAGWIWFPAGAWLVLSMVGAHTQGTAATHVSRVRSSAVRLSVQ